MNDVRLAPPINGAELRLELILEEIRGIRADLATQAASRPADSSASAQVELREPRVLGRKLPR